MNENYPQMSSDTPRILDAVSSNDVSSLRNLLESQDLFIFFQTAQNGTPEVATYLLSRNPVHEDYSEFDLSPNPTYKPKQYLAIQSAQHGNGFLFGHLMEQYPGLFSPLNRNFESTLLSAIDGGIVIWKHLLHHDRSLKDYAFSGGRGCVLEMVVYTKNKRLFEYLVTEGAYLESLQGSVFERLKDNGAGDDMLEFVQFYMKEKPHGK